MSDPLYRPAGNLDAGRRTRDERQGSKEDEDEELNDENNDEEMYDQGAGSPQGHTLPMRHRREKGDSIDTDTGDANHNNASQYRHRRSARIATNSVSRRSGSPPRQYVQGKWHVQERWRHRNDSEIRRDMRIWSEAAEKERIAEENRQAREWGKNAGELAGSESDRPDDLIGEFKRYMDRQREQEEQRRGREPVDKRAHDSTDQDSENSEDEEKPRPRKQVKRVIKRGKDSFIA